MPYITAEERRHLAEGFPPINPGQLNYAITKIINDYLSRNPEPPNYSMLNSVIGVLECAKLEFARRVLAPYEGEKQRVNGDVY